MLRETPPEIYSYMKTELISTGCPSQCSPSSREGSGSGMGTGMGSGSSPEHAAAPDARAKTAAQAKSFVIFIS
jgi:hypothetical protein